MVKCDHNFEYLGLKYDDTKRQRIGSGATDIEYFDVFFCRKCLAEEKKSKGYLTHSYEDFLAGSKPL